MEEVQDLTQARRLVAQLRARVEELREHEAHWKASHDAIAVELERVREACTGLRTELAVVRRELATYLEDQPRQWEIAKEHGQFLTTIRELKAELEGNETMREANAMAHRLVANLSADMTAIADALKGPPEPDSSHSWHDLVPLVRRQVRKYSVLMARNRKLREELDVSRAEAAHWKANHADLVKRNALLSERPDLPVDRIPAHAELVALQSARTLYADPMSTRKALDLIERTGTGVTGYVLQAESGGGACIVHRGAVRWLSDGELWDVVHPGA